MREILPEFWGFVSFLVNSKLEVFPHFPFLICLQIIWVCMCVFVCNAVRWFWRFEFSVSWCSGWYLSPLCKLQSSFSSSSPSLYICTYCGMKFPLILILKSFIIVIITYRSEQESREKKVLISAFCLYYILGILFFTSGTFFVASRLHILVISIQP